MLDAVWPNAFTVVTGLIVGAIPATVAHGLGSPDGRRLLTLLVVAVLVQAAGMCMGPLSQIFMMGQELGVTELSRRRLIQTALAPGGIAHLEDRAFSDRLALARGEGLRPPQRLPGMMHDIVQYWLAPLLAAAILFRFLWWAPIVLLAVNLLVRRWNAADIDLQFEGSEVGAGDLRRGAYYRDLALDGVAAKELRVFGLAGFVLDRLAGHTLTALAEIWRRRGRLTLLGLVTAIAVVAANVIVYGGIAWSALHGVLSLTALAICVQTVQNVIGLGSAWAEARYGLASRSAQALLRLPDAIPDQARVDGSEPAAGLPRSEIRFQGVCFHYPGGEAPVFDGLDLTIPAGTSTAIVGSNGAGKTTLTKLLARLYDPQGGTIAVDGLDLTSLSPAAWRRRIAVVFQDFTRYEMPARDNVGFGALELASDQRALEDVARQAGVLDLIESLPDGWDTVLSRAYTGGRDLSGGQWQRVVLARALLAARRGGVLVLDEPTANLDVRAEAEIFDRFLDLTRGLTTVLISHRFSTVRHAEQIVVLEHGRVLEQGSHDELVRLGGRYAEMFEMQAERFR